MRTGGAQGFQLQTFPVVFLAGLADTSHRWVGRACLSRVGIFPLFLQISKVGGGRHFDGGLPLAVAWESDQGNGLPFNHSFGDLDGGRREPGPPPLSSPPSRVGWGGKRNHVWIWIPPSRTSWQGNLADADNNTATEGQWED